MAKQAEVVREALKSKLQPGEQLRSVGMFMTGPFWAMMLVSSLFAFALKYYWIGVTDRRLILVRLNAWGKPSDEGNYDVPLSHVTVRGNALMVVLPDKEKPQQFVMNFGIQKLSGFDAKEFKAALNAN
jgi:hypothetical protein